MKPVIVLSNAEHQCVTFVWPDDLRYFVGYRFVEHIPKTTRKPLLHKENSPSQIPRAPDDRLAADEHWLDNWQTYYAKPDDPLQLTFQTFKDGSAMAHIIENGGAQERIWRFVPEDSGVSMWMTLKTEYPINGGYILQQCLRLTSGIGFGFRKSVARVPYLSELLMQALGNANGTLTWARLDGSWQPFPVPFTHYHTKAAEGVYEDSSGQIDCGLIVRESASREEAPPSYWDFVAPDASWETWSAGLYWERTAYISNRHPADCLHTGVDLGKLDPGESRIVQGKFYWIEGTKDDVYDLWRAEFEHPERNNTVS